MNELTIEDLRVLRSLFSIPRGKKNFMLLRGVEAVVAARLIGCGWVERGILSPDGETFRLLPAGRDAFLNELESRVDKSKPVKPQVDAIFAERRAS